MSPAPIALSVLDLSPVVSGVPPPESLQRTLDLARFVDGLGYRRYWLAEHHNTPGIASSVPEIMIGQVAAVTKNLRVGSGGVMLPNHPPLRVVECFRVLEALFPGRIDLGLGRAPGTDLLTAYALRRSQEALSGEDFPAQLAELLAFFSGEFPGDHPFAKITPVPQGVPAPELWLLGSSDFSARLSAELGLGFAFAHHINPVLAVASLRHYLEMFRPSPWNAEPHAMLAVSAVCAETDAEAEELAKSMDLAWLWMEQNRRAPLPTVAEATEYPYTPVERDRVRQNRARHFVGSPRTLRERLGAFCAELGVTELMVMTMVHDHAKRRRSYALLADAFR